MSRKILPGPSPDERIELEAERYELQTQPQQDGGSVVNLDFEPSRRGFLGILGGGLIVLCLDPETEAQESGGGGRRREIGQRLPREIGAWLQIAEDGTVTASTGKVEVGQNARTSLTQAVADELRLPIESVRLVMGDTDRVPFDMGTFGSRTTPTMVPQLRRAAAAARGLLLDQAAARLGVGRDSLLVAGGVVSHAGSGKSLSFGDLTRGKRLVETIDDTPTTPAEQWQAAGRSAPKVDALAIVTGRHRYPSDVSRKGMLRGKVLRPPTFGSRLASLDSSAAKKLPGVIVVREGDFAGVLAEDEQTATRALAALKATWTPPSDPGPSDRELPEYLKEHAETRPPASSSVEAETGTDPTRVKLKASYTIAYIAHAPLEPRAALAEWSEGKLTVWTGTQRPFGVRTELAQAFRIPEERIRVIVPDTGSGYGGKHTGEAAREAARLARAAKRPVKLVWSREEEFTWAYFRPGGVIDVALTASKDGKLVSWEYHNYNSGGSGLATPYTVPTPRTAFHPGKSPLRQGSYRALASTANHFARESMMDEAAHALGLDPLEFRLKNLEVPRLQAVLEAAAGQFGWKTSASTLGPNRGCGLACGTEKGSYVATCAEVSVDPSTRAAKVERVTTAFDCGAVVNPDHLKNQVEGALVMGLGGALFEAIRFEDGKVLNPRFSRYRVPRFGDMPRIEVTLLDHRNIPSAGAGETPIIAIAPAIASAIFRATGVRIRSMPLVPDGVVKG